MFKYLRMFFMVPSDREAELEELLEVQKDLTALYQRHSEFLKEHLDLANIRTDRAIAVAKGWKKTATEYKEMVESQLDHQSSDANISKH